MFDFALSTAQELDRYYAEHGTVKGPLHGLPISLKDQFHVKGYDTTMGYIGWIGTYEGDPDPAKVNKINSQVVEELLSLGAVLYCKVIFPLLLPLLPQTLLFGETVNNLIGTTLNPVNQYLSCGGSSGGEGALQALRGSSVGLGTDIGGSVRIPASFCGTYSIKPTHNRLSYRNVANTNPGQDTYASSVGVMGTTIDAVKLVLSSLLSTEPWMRDPNVVRMPWDGNVERSTLARASSDGSANGEKPLKIGIYWSDGVVTPQPPVSRGMKIVHDVLENLGHKVVNWEPPSQSTAKRVHLAFLKADGAHDIHRQLDLSGEPLVPPLRNAFQLRDPISLLEYQDLTIQGKTYCEAYTDYWNSTSSQLVDAVLMPVAPHAAVIPGKFYHTAYTESINLMDFSAAVFPVTKADKTIDEFNTDYQPLNEQDRKNWEAYDPEIYDGAPVGLQIVCRKWEEEKVWAIAKIIDNGLKTMAAN
ncbi:mycophenolic acid synthesis protein B [Physcia stellaris]|nr:mycophenolic acid synthesis protein B [Physcia stellaris]